MCLLERERADQMHLKGELNLVRRNNGWSVEYLKSTMFLWLGSWGINDGCSFNRFAEHSMVHPSTVLWGPVAALLPIDWASVQGCSPVWNPDVNQLWMKCFHVGPSIRPRGRGEE